MKYFIFLLASFNSFCNSKDSKPDELNAKTTQIVEKTDPANEETIVLGGGCFWCLEAVYQDLNGVTKVESGYSNGHVDNPTYKQVCSGLTGHAEVVKLTFDNKKVSLNDILDVFWTIHDPTTLNRQGNDSGPQYRSGIYYYNEAKTYDYLISKGVNADDIYRDYAGFNTYDSIYRAGYIFKVQSIIICTQRFHIYRALYIAKRLGFKAYGYAAENKSIYNMTYNHIRESLARIKAVLETDIMKRQPKYLGDPIPVKQYE